MQACLTNMQHGTGGVKSSVDSGIAPLKTQEGAAAVSRRPALHEHRADQHAAEVTAAEQAHAQGIVREMKQLQQQMATRDEALKQWLLEQFEAQGQQLAALAADAARHRQAIALAEAHRGRQYAVQQKRLLGYVSERVEAQLDQVLVRMGGRHGSGMLAAAVLSLLVRACWSWSQSCFQKDSMVPSQACILRSQCALLLRPHLQVSQAVGAANAKALFQAHV